MSETGSILDYLEKGGKLTASDNAPSRYRAELLRMMASFVDSELAAAAGFADKINEGPGITERIAASRIVLEKSDHAERVLRLMGEFGADIERYENVHPWSARVGRDEDLGALRLEGDMRLNVLHYPMTDWTDAVVMNVLMGRATIIQLKELLSCSYQPLANALAEILSRERRHTELGEQGLKKLITEGAKAEISASLGYWRPRVAASFGAADSPRFGQLCKFGLRYTSNAVLLSAWQNDTDKLFASAII